MLQSKDIGWGTEWKKKKKKKRNKKNKAYLGAAYKALFGLNSPKDLNWGNEKNIYHAKNIKRNPVPILISGKKTLKSRL